MARITFSASATQSMVISVDAIFFLKSGTVVPAWFVWFPVCSFISLAFPWGDTAPQWGACKGACHHRL